MELWSQDSQGRKPSFVLCLLPLPLSRNWKKYSRQPRQSDGRDTPSHRPKLCLRCSIFNLGTEMSCNTNLVEIHHHHQIHDQAATVRHKQLSASQWRHKARPRGRLCFHSNGTVVSHPDAALVGDSRGLRVACGGTLSRLTQDWSLCKSLGYHPWGQHLPHRLSSTSSHHSPHSYNSTSRQRVGLGHSAAVNFHINCYKSPGLLHGNSASRE
ncbi:hypothetical protein QBC45DRAFT_20916 [Copromyces sp. CBS 386.78]|nr:hypothetical protein QBC45DRAFT_20916 [Copromyces sp. CBS 386.78]